MTEFGKCPYCHRHHELQTFMFGGIELYTCDAVPHGTIAQIEKAAPAPDVKWAQEVLTMMMSYMESSEHAPHYGATGCICGPDATPHPACPLHWCLAELESLRRRAALLDRAGDAGQSRQRRVS